MFTLLKLNQFKGSFYIGMLLLGAMSLSNLTHASMEVTVYGGGNFHKEILLSEVLPEEPNQEFNSWIIGFDLVYRSLLSDSKCGLGLRYQHNFRSHPYNANSSTEQKLMFNSNRIAILGSYRFINPDDNAGLFLGALAAWDIFRSMSIQVDAGSDQSARNTLDLTSHQWFGLTGQVGLEAGFRWTNFFVKGEVGYSLYGFNTFKCTGQKCPRENIEDEDLGLSAIYGTIGIGWFFI